MTEKYTPLLWSAEGNSEAASQQDGRVISVNDKYAFLAAPFNTGNDYRSCKNGGEWTAAQSGQKIQVTVSGYEMDLGQLPYTDAKNDPAVYTYYNPNTSKGYWDIQTACFSAGEFWILQPFYDAQGGYIADEYGNGNFTMTVEDGNLMVTGESGQSLEEKDDNSNQMVIKDDRESVSMALEQPGEIEQYIRYAGTDVTNAYQNEGKDWSLSGGEISIQEQLAHLGAEGLHTAVAYDDLIFFSDLGELKAQGYTCVAVLMEVRGVASSQSTEIYFTAQGSLKDTAKQGKVYMVTHSAKAWNKEDVQEAAAKALGKEVSELNDEDYKTYAQQYLPSRADQMTAPD